MPSAHIKGLVIAQSAIARSAYAFRIILDIWSGEQPIGNGQVSLQPSGPVVTLQSLHSAKCIKNKCSDCTKSACTCVCHQPIRKTMQRENILDLQTASFKCAGTGNAGGKF